MIITAAAMGSTFLGDGPSDLVTAAAVVGLAVMLVAMVMADALRRAAARTRP